MVPQPTWLLRYHVPNTRTELPANPVCPADTEPGFTARPPKSCVSRNAQVGSAARSACCRLEARGQFGKIKIELLNWVSDLVGLPSKVSASAVGAGSATSTRVKRYTFIAELCSCVQTITLEAVPSWPCKCKPHLFFSW